jgi:hypothetical protein
MQTIGLGTSTVVEIISVYAASNQVVPAVADPPAWRVVGAFYMPATAPVKLEVIGAVTVAGIEMTMRIFDVTAAAPVSGSTTPVIDGIVDERQISGAFELPGGKIYQMQAQVIGPDPDTKGFIRSATLIGG